MKKTTVLNYVIALLCFTASWAQSTVTVSSLADDNTTGTLRWAMNTANADVTINEINFAKGLTGTITLASNLPNVSSNLSIYGPGASNMTISGDGQYKMFVVNSGRTLNISGFTFTNSASDYSNGNIFAVNGSTVNASDIVVTGITNYTAFWSKNANSVINISNSTFSNNSVVLFMSDWGSTPNTTSDNESDYNNRITVTGSTFSSNTGQIFSTQRYVKIDDCIFSDNSNKIAHFAGVNRFQVLNSTFTNNTGYHLFSFSSWIGDIPSWGEGTLGTNNTLFDGNVFTGNTGTIINPGGKAAYDNKTTISNNIFENNGTNWSGNPVVVSGNLLNNFFTSITHSVNDATVSVTMGKAVFNTDAGSGALEANDFQFVLTGGNATLGSATPTSISASGNTYILGINLVGDINGTEELTISPVDETSIYDAAMNRASIAQKTNKIILNFLDDDVDGVANYLDLCPDTPAGEIVEADGCTDVTKPLAPIEFTSKAGINSIDLKWTENTGDTKGYRLYGGTDENQLELIVDMDYVYWTEYKHTGLIAKTTYYYSITAYDLAGNESSFSPVISNAPKVPFIWDGPKVVVEKLSNSDWTLAENQDFLTDNVILTRADNKGLFNIAEEAGYDEINAQSPADTEWAWGTTADLESLSFSSWAYNMSYLEIYPFYYINRDFVLHLITEDIYIDVKILSWADSDSGGGFSYERSTASPDQDGDRIKDSLDECPDTPLGEEVDLNGCSDSQKDEDQDGVNDALDICDNTPIGEIADSNGCSASQKDTDDDGLMDDVDACHNTPTGETVDANGCSASQKDSDNDGVSDAIDTCDNTPSGETVDANGCSDSQKDGDNDGVMDDADSCANTPSGETVDASGCSDTQKDSDTDGVSNAIDACDNTPSGEAVDVNGCSDSQKDTDGDGINNEMDECPDTPAGETVDSLGCSDSQKDSDFDGVKDAEDQCPDSPEDEAVDVNGCSDSQKDADNDGVTNAMDECPGTPLNAIVDANGCADSQKDADDDGIQDSQDNCPTTFNPGQEDRDNDGKGDVCDTVELNVSEAFTPNGDGINDTWVIYNIENYPNSLVQVFNSWGKVVLSARNYQNDWDGRYKDLGSKLPDAGSYYFQIDFEGDGKVDQDGWLYIGSN